MYKASEKRLFYNSKFDIMVIFNLKSMKKVKRISIKVCILNKTEKEKEDCG